MPDPAVRGPGRPGARRPPARPRHYASTIVDQGPLPPHERTWRHPSELAADESAFVRADPGGRSTRVAAITAGTLGLLAVGVLALWVTPSRGAAPMAVQQSAIRFDPGFAVTTLHVEAGTAGSTRLPGSGPLGGAVGSVAGVVTTVVAWIDTGAPATGPAALATVETTVPPATLAAPAPTTPALPPTTEATPPATFADSAPVTIREMLAAALATPLDDGLAVVTARSVWGHGEGDTVSVMFASGESTLAEILAMFERSVVIALDAEPTDQPGHELADEPLEADATVTVLLDPPIDIALSELPGLAAPEGTPVLDDEGALVGLCTLADDGTTALALVDASADDYTTGTSPGTSPGASPDSAPGTPPVSGNAPSSDSTSSDPGTPASEPGP